MSVGVAALDADHRVLVDLINRLGSLDEGDPKVMQAVEDVLDALIAYTEFHFMREEKVMEACAYPGLSLHQEEHRALEDDVHILHQKFLAGDAELPLATIRAFLIAWLN